MQVEMSEEMLKHLHFVLTSDNAQCDIFMEDDDRPEFVEKKKETKRKNWKAIRVIEKALGCSFEYSNIEKLKAKGKVKA